MSISNIIHSELIISLLIINQFGTINMKWFSLKIKRKLMTGLSVFWVCAGMAVQTVGEPSISLSLRKGTLKELFVAIENK